MGNPKVDFNINEDDKSLLMKTTLRREFNEDDDSLLMKTTQPINDINDSSVFEKETDVKDKDKDEDSPTIVTYSSFEAVLRMIENDPTPDEIPTDEELMKELDELERVKGNISLTEEDKKSH